MDENLLAYIGYYLVFLVILSFVVIQIKRIILILIMINIANILVTIKYNEYAKKIYLTYLDKCKKLFGDKSNYVAKILINLANIYDKQNDFTQAMTLREQAISIWKHNLGYNPNYVITLDKQGDSHKKSGNIKEAKKYYQDAQHHIREISNSQSPLFSIIFRYYYKKLLNKLHESEKELNNLEQDYLQRQSELEQANKLAYLNYMAGGVAHNINNPVGIIRLAAQRGLRELEKDLSPEKAQEIFQRILTQADRLHNIIQNFRDYAKGDREKREMVALNAVVEQIKDYFSNQLAAHQIELITELAIENPHIEANHFVLQEVLINLLSNARDALENQLNAQIIITTWAQTEKVGISIADNGSGISPEQQKSLFSPFHTTKAHGTGLGLNFAQKAVHELHGTIRYQENLPRGACFVIEFPKNTTDNIPIS